MTRYDTCEWCGRDIIDSEMKEEMLCQTCTQAFVDECLREARAIAREEAKEPSHVLASDGGWIVDLRWTGGPILTAEDGQPFPTEAEARDAERVWLSATWGW